jgi:lipoic acid synthetase
LKDGGAAHFAECIRAVREKMPDITIEILTPDFRKRVEVALDILKSSPPDVFNHNLETVPRLYRHVRPGAVYEGSLDLIQRFKSQHPAVPTKSGLMLGLGETIEEVKEVLHDLRNHDCDWLTLGQYLQPSRHHLPVQRFVSPYEFNELGDYARQIGFKNVASGPMVRSSYHADMQAQGEVVGNIAL